MLWLQKRWSAPTIVDRALKYIPELESEVEALRCNKENVQSQAKGNKNMNPSVGSDYGSPTISMNRVNQEEAVIQVCMPTQNESQFINLLHSVEDEDICINSASALHISDTTICYHLHIQVISYSFHQFYI